MAVGVTVSGISLLQDASLIAKFHAGRLHFMSLFQRCCLLLSEAKFFEDSLESFGVSFSFFFTSQILHPLVLVQRSLVHVPERIYCQAWDL